MRAATDVLGDEGRKVVDTCVKVKIMGIQKNTLEKYRRNQALRQLLSCYAGEIPNKDEYSWRTIVDHTMLPPQYDDNGKRKEGETYDIFDIHDALESFDKKPYVEKYPKQGTGCDELKNLINERRKEVEEEFKEAIDNRSARTEYSWAVAQRRVRDCYAGNFAGDSLIFIVDKRHYNIVDIYETVRKWNFEWRETTGATCVQKGGQGRTVFVFTDTNYVLNVLEGPGCDELKRSVKKQISNVQNEYQEAKRNLKQYSKEEAVKKVKDCLMYDPSALKHSIFSSKNDEGRERSGNNQKYDIFDIRQELLQLSNIVDWNGSFAQLVSEELNAEVSWLGKYTYSRWEAERRVRDCLLSAYSYDTDIFPNKNENWSKPKTEQTYDIFDIKAAIDYFDEKTLLDKYRNENAPESEKRNKNVDEERKKIEKEYDTAKEPVEIEHGSGFIISDHYVITNKHVVEEITNEQVVEESERKKILIYNAAIGGEGLLSEVADTDITKDLALIYCKELNIEQCGITPLHLSSEKLLLGMQTFAFGYPFSHTGKSALFVNGYVSGFKELDDKPTLAVLNCSLNLGNSGGPILCWFGDQLKVVGVATQKHIKDILTLNEMEKIEKIRESLQTSSISGISDSSIKYSSYQREYLVNSRPDPCQPPMNLLTLKLYDALETHSQFNLGNALPGHYVIEFIEKFLRKCKGESNDELKRVVKWSAVHKNILPSGHHSASDCCIQ